MEKVKENIAVYDNTVVEKNNPKFFSIQQTVEIPENRRIFLDVPLNLPVGKAKVTVTFQTEKPAVNIYEAITNLRGLSKKMGSTLTVERFHEMQREDLCLEEEQYLKLFPNRG